RNKVSKKETRIIGGDMPVEKLFGTLITKPHKIFLAFVAADFFMLLMYVATNWVIPIPSWTFRHWFDMDAETNIQTWYSSMQLFVIAIACLALCRARFDDTQLRRFYMLAIAVFIFLSADESGQIHEGIG